MAEPEVVQTEQVVEPVESTPTPEQLAEAEEQKRQAEEKERQEQAEVEKKPWFQRRIDEITRQKYEALERARLAEEEAAKLKEAQQKKQEPAPQVQGDQKPTREQFDYDEEKYIDAYTEWAFQQRATIADRERQAALQNEEQQKRQMSFNQKLTATVADGRTKFQDWDQVVPTVPAAIMHQDLIAATVELQNGAGVAYYLAKNLQEAEKISKLSPFAMAAELGKIESKLSERTPKQTNAPPPVNALAGGKPVSGDVDPEKNPAEWIRLRNEGKL